MHIITSKCQGICHTSRSDKYHSYKTGWFLFFQTPHPGLLRMAVFCPAFQSSFSTSALSLFLFVLNSLCSHYLFLLSFPNVTVHFYSLMLVAQCLSWTTVILFPPPLGGAWLGPYIISVICTCHPQGSATWPIHRMPVHLTVTVCSLIKDVSFAAYRWVQLKDNSVSLASLNDDKIKILWNNINLTSS